MEFYSTPFVFLTDTFTGEFLRGRYRSHNYLLKSLRVAIVTNHISLNFPHKDVSLRKRWYLSIPQLVLIIFGLGIVFNTLCISYGRIHGRVIFFAEALVFTFTFLENQKIIAAALPTAVG